MSESAAETWRHVGVGTPQANPTVEIELRHWLKPPLSVQATRLVSAAAEPADRLRAYVEELPRALASYDTLPLRLFLFACTGSSYLLGPEAEDALVDELSQRHGYPVITATAAIMAQLKARSISRFALLAPYPQWLVEAALAYWQARGFEVMTVSRLDVGADTRRIYDITAGQALAAIEEMATGDAPVTVITGTGMPSRHAIEQSQRPLLSSNYCLALAALAHLGPKP